MSSPESSAPSSDPEIVRRLDYVVVLLAVIAATLVLGFALASNEPSVSVVFGLLVFAVGGFAYLAVRSDD